MHNRQSLKERQGLSGIWVLGVALSTSSVVFPHLQNVDNTTCVSPWVCYEKSKKIVFETIP